jgi:hypothetical protein
VTTPSGDPISGVQTTLAGSITPSGALQVLRIVLLNITGSITAIGNLIRQPQQILSGVQTATGNTVKSISTAYTGVTAPDGGYITGIQTTLSGSVTPGSLLSQLRTTFVTAAGVVTATGNLINEATILTIIGIVDLTLRARNITLTLLNRGTGLTVSERDTDLTIEER